MSYLIAAALDKLETITWYSTDKNGRLREGAAQQHEAYVPYDVIENMLRELGELDEEQSKF